MWTLLPILALGVAAPMVRLGRGVRLYVTGQYDNARNELLPLLHVHQPAQDHALYYLGQASFYSAEYDSAKQAFSELAALKESRLSATAEWRLADVSFAQGRTDEARAAYEALLRRNLAGGDPSVARHRLAQMYQASGNGPRARELWRRIYIEDPGHPLAQFAQKMIEQAHEPVTVQERLSRANTLLGLRKWDLALEELAKIPQDAPPALHDEAMLVEGMTKFRMRRDYDAAAQRLLGVFARLPGDKAASALFHGARALSRANRDDDAIARYHEVVARFPNSRWAIEAQFLTGWLEFNRERYEAALPALSDLLRRYPRSSFADEAVWYLGFSNYLLGRYGEAQRYFAQLTRMQVKAYTLAKARYWLARSQEHTGTGTPIAAYRELVTSVPLSWYALLASARLREHGVKQSPFGDSIAIPRLGTVRRSLKADPALAKVEALLGADLPVEAGEELRRAETHLLRKLSAMAGLPLVLDLYRRASNWNRVYLLGEAYGGKALHTRPKGPARLYWEAAYPLAYREWIEKYGPKSGNPEFYLYAIMRKESGYYPYDVSYADAIGLLQMIPPTSRRVAAALGRVYTDDLLYEPASNIALGAWYIGHLLRKFKVQIPLGAGAFNAGPAPMIRWLAEHGSRPMDEFVELCAYTQTREYMKLVTDNYAHYLYLYTGKVYELPLVVNRSHISDDGIDY